MLETIDLKYLLHLRHYFVLQIIVKSFSISKSMGGSKQFFNIDYSEWPITVMLTTMAQYVQPLSSQFVANSMFPSVIY